MNTSFRVEIEKLINRESVENGSDTPDFILAEYLCDCLEAFDRAVTAREKWYGREPKKVPFHEWPVRPNRKNPITNDVGKSPCLPSEYVQFDKITTGPKQTANEQENSQTDPEFRPAERIQPEAR